MLHSVRSYQTQRQIDRHLVSRGNSVLLRPREDVAKGQQLAPAFWNPAADRIPAVNIFANLPLLSRLKQFRSQHIAWHLSGNSTQEAFYLTTTWSSTKQTLLNQLAATYPGLQSVLCDNVLEPLSGGNSAESSNLATTHGYTIYLQPRDWIFPLTTTTLEPLTPFMLRLNRLPTDQHAGMTLLLRRGDKKIHKQLREAVQSAEETKQRERLKRLFTRTHGAWFDVILTIHATAQTQQQARATAEQLAGDLRAAVDPDNPLQIAKRHAHPASLAWNNRYSTPLHETDVALLAHLVGRDATVQGIALETAASVVCYPESACFVSKKSARFYQGRERLVTPSQSSLSRK